MPSLDNALAIVIGIAQYENISSLPPSVTKDATDIFNLLTAPAYGGYPPQNVQLLLNENATRARILEAAAKIAERCTADSTAFLYISSHGARIRRGKDSENFILPHDVDTRSEEAIEATAVSGEQLSEALRRIPARKLTVMFDSCHSGGVAQIKGLTTFNPISEDLYDQLRVGRGRAIFASSRSDEYSFVSANAQNSVFTHFMLEGLRGAAPGPGGVIRIFDLFHYVQQHVVQAQPNQHPIFKAEVEDNYPIALWQGGKKYEVALKAELPDDGFKYDVFVSYRQIEPDKTWVRKTLVPQLKASGLRVCIDYQDFGLGKPLIKEIERAVMESRYTLGILTPAYLQSNFTELENILAQHLGLEASQRRWIAIMRQDCEPNLLIRARLWLDMQDDQEFRTDAERLVMELRQPATM